MPGADPASAPTPDDPGWEAWVESIAFSPEGVDRALIWASLARTPAQRLEILERTVNEILELRGGRWPEIR